MTKPVLLACLALIATPAAAAPPAYAPLPPPPEVDPTTVPMPELSFTATEDAEGAYDKYFYFHREGTAFTTAYADIRECDQYARGYTVGAGYVDPAYAASYGVGGVMGAAIGSAVADAIFGSALRRQMRRTNLRTCMGFKDYKAYGLPKHLWSVFNFEEGNSPPSEDEREQKIRMQAKAASGPKPAIGEIKS